MVTLLPILNKKKDKFYLFIYCVIMAIFTFIPIAILIFKKFRVLHTKSAIWRSSGISKAVLPNQIFFKYSYSFHHFHPGHAVPMETAV